MSRKKLFANAARVGGLNILTRIVGIARAFLQLQFLGVGVLSDAFILAFRLPNFLRKIFAEGAMSAAFVPTFSTLLARKKESEAQRLLSLALIAIAAMLSLLTVCIWLFPGQILSLMAPKFGVERMAHAVPLMRVLFPFVFFVAIGSLFGSMLHAANRFAGVAFGITLFNFLYLVGLVVCMQFQLSVYVLCGFILAGGASLMLLNVVLYRMQGFRFSLPSWDDVPVLQRVFRRVPQALLGISALELNIMLDTFMAAGLPAGHLTMVHYGARFMSIPLSVFGVAFSTVLLPHFTQLKERAPSRFTYYLLEATKLVVWLLVPAALALHFFAPAIFTTFLAGKTDAAGMAIAANVLSLYSIGLVLFALQKVVLSLLYAVHDTRTAAQATGIATAVNAVGNIIAVFYCHSVYGVAIATVCGALAMLIFLLWRLHVVHRVSFALRRFARFLPGMLLQVSVVSVIYVAVHHVLFNLALSSMFQTGYLYWGAVAPLVCGIAYVLYRTRRWAGVQLYFLG